MILRLVAGVKVPQRPFRYTKSFLAQSQFRPPLSSGFPLSKGNILFRKWLPTPEVSRSSSPTQHPLLLLPPTRFPSNLHYHCPFLSGNLTDRKSDLRFIQSHLSIHFVPGVRIPHTFGCVSPTVVINFDPRRVGIPDQSSLSEDGSGGLLTLYRPSNKTRHRTRSEFTPPILTILNQLSSS